jgi:DNA recombination protein RmuC
MHELLWLLAGTGIGAVVFLLARRKPDTGALSLLQAQVAQLSNQLNERMKETSSTLHSSSAAVGQRLDNATSMVALLERKLGAMEESGKRLHALGEGLQELRDILKSPKLRGNMGEFFLEDLLRQILPSGHYETQYAFRGGETVDAVIRVGEALVCVDSKFPLESYVRLLQLPESDTDGKRREKRAFTNAIKKHADSIAKKYILPDEGTYDFALMYIPAEGVYYETMLREDAGEDSLHSYLLARRVIPVSPSSLYAYLQVIVLGLRGLKVETHARKMAQDLSRLSGELGRFGAEYAVLGKHLKNAGGSFDEGAKRLERFTLKLDGITVAPDVIPAQPETGNSPELTR